MVLWFFSSSESCKRREGNNKFFPWLTSEYLNPPRWCPWAAFTQSIFAEGQVICPGFYSAPSLNRRFLGDWRAFLHLFTISNSSCSSAMRLGLDCAHHQARMVPATGCGCLSPELKGTQAGCKANPGSFQGTVWGGFINAYFLWLWFLNTWGCFA